MKKANQTGKSHNVSTWQMTSLITSTLIGVGVLTLPRSTTESLREAGWLAPILGGMIDMAAIWMIAKLTERFHGMTFIEFSKMIWGPAKHPTWGKILSTPWVFVYLVFLYLTVAVTSRIFGEVVVTSVLLETPLEVLIISMFVLAFILCLHEEETMVRVNEILFPLILFPVLFIAIASFQNAEWNNLFPLFSVGWTELFKGALESAFSYQGFEIMLMFYAFAHHNSDRVRAGFYGMGIAIVVYTLIVLAGIVVFGYEELQKATWPTLELVKTTQVPGLILERLESAFLAVWVAAVFTSVGNVYYTVIYGLRQYFGRGVLFQRISAFVLLIPLFFISLIPQNINELFVYTGYLGYIGLFVAIGLPLLYWLVLLARGMYHRSSGRETDAM